MKRAVIAVLIMLSMTACSIQGTPIGGRHPSTTPRPDACAQHAVDPPVRAIPVPVPGRNLMTVTAAIQAWSYTMVDGKPGALNRDWCVPFLYTMIVRVAGLDDIVIVERGTGRGQTSPASGRGKTPWISDGKVLWDRFHQATGIARCSKSHRDSDDVSPD